MRLAFFSFDDVPRECISVLDDECRSALVQRRASAAAELVRRRSQFGSLASADLEVGSEAPADAPPVESAVVPAVVAVSSSAAAASVASSPPKPNGPTPQEQQTELRTPLTIPRVHPGVPTPADAAHCRTARARAHTQSSDAVCRRCPFRAQAVETDPSAGLLWRFRNRTSR